MPMILACILVTAALMLASPLSAQDSSFITVPKIDEEMVLAKAKARETLPLFWAKFANPAPNENGFVLKVALPHGNGSTEHIWTRNVEMKDGKIFATINNVPRHVKNVRLGDRIEVKEEQISDWLYLRDGKIVGNYTLKPVLKRMPPADAAKYRATLAEP